MRIWILVFNTKEKYILKCNIDVEVEADTTYKGQICVCFSLKVSNANIWIRSTYKNKFVVYEHVLAF